MKNKLDIDLLIEQLNELDLTELSVRDRVTVFNKLSDLAAKIIQFKHPVLNVKLISSSQVKDNDYNPNTVAPPEFKLLRHSIKKDGVTMPIIVGKQSGSDDYVIIDGYHRSRILKQDLNIKQSLSSYMPVVILTKEIDDRMSSSIRHNVARGTHQVELTSQLVIKLRQMDWTNEDIGRELGMDKDEVLRMQQITGLADAFRHNSFSNAWK
ncbi:ParB/RepB/Spo0J family partition protein [Shewanella sp. D64]|uniref:IbrB-like domain-containing protein n=1 Tax=unclassified Shewanella TaxID=196818 RepID=UPI0022BA2ED5|nr:MULTISPECIES: ParB/RepB/Spo0J family partition protein [unclassified Shewanella]MEC4726259.1 ParB/RepB/Spo0J family partition protein [Shewanella sp. D64]MEC4738271.1 ParB/RepB/Spo0J family partition protein [Shewanella sp. E94]WBJ95409.1 ParB/RepB/Spo0J family partition protein [Shewanella sp. MTB7]